VSCITCPNCGERIGPRPAEVLQLGRLTLDTASRTAFVDGEQRRLGQRKAAGRPDYEYAGRGKEWTILEAMVRNPGRVFSREALLNLTDSWDTDGHIIEVLLSRLRKSVGDAVWIKNFYTVGWALYERGAETPDTIADGSDVRSIGVLGARMWQAAEGLDGLNWIRRNSR
jgi:hypothetical protein